MISDYIKKLAIQKNKTRKCKILLPETTDKRVLKAGIDACNLGIADIVFLGKKSEIISNNQEFDFRNICFLELSNTDIEELTNELFLKRQAKGITLEGAQKLMRNKMYQSIMLLNKGLIDGVVAGAITSTAEVLRPALQIIKTKKDCNVASSSMILCDFNNFDRDYLILSDCGLVVSPTTEELISIAQGAIKLQQIVSNEDPKIAFLSYSTNNFELGETSKKMSDAYRLFYLKYPDITAEGEMQVDCALDEFVSKIKYPNSKIKGKANILIFPNLESANISYKLAQRLSQCSAIGPIINGLNKPVNDLSRGAQTEEIVNVIAITVLQI